MAYSLDELPDTVKSEIEFDTKTALPKRLHQLKIMAVQARLDGDWKSWFLLIDAQVSDLFGYLDDGEKEKLKRHQAKIRVAYEKHRGAYTKTVRARKNGSLQSYPDGWEIYPLIDAYEQELNDLQKRCKIE